MASANSLAALSRRRCFDGVGGGERKERKEVRKGLLIDDDSQLRKALMRDQFNFDFLSSIRALPPVHYDVMQNNFSAF